jgi:methyltransferase (TIGR00027 family)
VPDQASSQRDASSTAVLVCQGRATADGRYAVGRFSDPVARELLDPPEIGVVDDVRQGRLPASGAHRMSHELVRRTGVTMVPRTIAIDDAIRAHAARQVVILGAGLDARAWRMTELATATVFEVDHPASSRDKIRRIAGRPAVAAQVVPVAVDLARDALAPALESESFDRSQRTTWVWEGVVPYLTAEAVRSTVNQVGHLSAPGSRLIVNYQARSFGKATLRRIVRLVLGATGQSDPLAREPWLSLWRPDGIRDLLADNDFDVESDHDLMELSTGLDLPSGNAGSLRIGRVAIATRR